ncbi:MAG: hypothetical protein K2N57_02260 [Clostridia bacterium]|nr:hypothetical protein [Clostridia bacterium]
MKKIIISIIVAITIVTLVLLAGCTPPPETTEVDLNFDGLGSKPNDAAAANATAVDKSKITFSEEQTDNADVLNSIVYIIGLSNQNNMNADFYAAAAYGTGDAKIKFGSDIVGSMDIRDWRIYDNGEYFFDSYGLVVGGYTIKSDGSHGSVSDAILNPISGVLNYTKRIYSPDSETFYISNNGESSNDSFLLFPSVDAITYKKPKSKKKTLDEFIEYNYNRESFREYSSDNFTVENAIVTGSLTYDEEKGIYTIECTLNCEDEKVLDLSTKSMIESCGSDIFRYVEKTITLEIWECGLIRRYYNTNIWEATLLPKSLKVKGSSDSKYEQLFTYNKDGLELLNVPDEIKKAMMA